MSQRTFSIMGDSISTFEGYIPAENAVYYTGPQLEETGVESVEQTWWMQVINALDGKLLSNASYSGSLVEGAGFPAGSSDERVAQLAGAHGESPDVILVFMGINDYGWGGAQHQAMARGNAVPKYVDYSQVPEGPIGEAPMHARELFEQAYDVMLVKMRRAFPQAEIWCLTLLPGREKETLHPAFCYSLRGISLSAYNDAINAAAKKNGCKVADIYDLEFDYETTDGTHPTALGMEQLAAMVVAEMTSSPNILEDERLFPPVMYSRVMCARSQCVGCEFVRAVGETWSCVCEQ